MANLSSCPPCVMLNSKYASELVMMAMLIIPALRSQKQEGCKFEDSLSHIAHSKSVIILDN